MTGKKKLIEALESIDFVSGTTIFQQGKFPVELSYPNEFVTFQTSTVDGTHYNDDVLFTVWNVTVNYFSNSIRQLETRVKEIRDVLKANGFIINGKGEDAMSDEQSHTGWRMVFTFKDYE